MGLKAELPRRVFDGFGLAAVGMSVFAQPRTTAEVAALFKRASEEGVHVAMRGSGRSYGDAALNTGELVIDMRSMDKVLAWDGETGVIELEPGVTIQSLWQHILADGWWPPVVPGTSAPTLGGAIAMNVHGKNQYKLGGIGDHVLELDLVTPGGETLTCSREVESELFHGVIGGFGMLGCITRIHMQMKRVYGGRLLVQQWAVPSLQGQFDAFAEGAQDDYFVSWTDCFGLGGSPAGRGQMHRACYVKEGEDPLAAETLAVDKQALPKTMMGVPMPLVPTVLKVMYSSNVGVQFTNQVKYTASKFGSTKPFLQAHAAFHFLLDQMPGFRNAYDPGGFIQYQPFVPKEHAKEVFTDILRISKARGMVSYLGVMKRYREDDFLMSHALDGFSMALDYPVTRDNKAALWQMTQEFSDMVIEAGGLFYPAKDLVIRPDQFQRAWGQERVTAFRTLRNRCDPQKILRTDLSARYGLDE
ncbi:MAG: FAD-binding oxidoreductase [Proteobacteria bacterium]|nr:FAD-binding oxidoreductase [Pseudomonadota bacterium]